MPKISQLIVSDVERQCAFHLRHVSDIPRLYRRTNKDAPSKAFSYVSHLLAAVKEFRVQYMDQTESLTQWTHDVIKALSLQLSIPMDISFHSIALLIYFLNFVL